MQRHVIQPRSNWQEKVESVGLLYHSVDNPYWDESAYYEFTSREIDEIERVTNRLHGMCLDAGQYIIDNRLFGKLSIPDAAVPHIIETWNSEPPALYGRFDLAYDGERLVMLEYNADTPTGLVEAAIAQWYWLQELFPNRDQFNSLHERLIAKWKDLLPYLNGPVYFGHMDTLEDTMTINYLRDTAEQAGHKTFGILMKDIGWDGERFVDSAEAPMYSIFKLYPWEMLVVDDFGPQALKSLRHTAWIEPIWKMMLSNKGILAVLWEMFPNDANLLPAQFSPQSDSYVKKPLLSREGANVTIVRDGCIVEATHGQYAEGEYVYQAIANNKNFAGKTPILGTWMIDQEAGGMGIRETDTLVTNNTSRFVPHLF